MTALDGVAVLVTRPEQQAAPLCRLLESRGAIAIRLPVLEIKPAGDRGELTGRLGSIDAFDLVIFTSANAVQFGVALLGRGRAPAIAAIGPATARALEKAGFRVTILPKGGFDSEHLLAHPALEQAAERRILLIKGLEGRTLLEERLTQRGARMVVAEVYRRERANHRLEYLAALEAQFAAGTIHVITATSGEIAAALLALATPAMRREFDRVPWLVPSARVAAAVRERGITAPVLLADSAEDQDLVAAIERWRSSVSGA